MVLKPRWLLNALYILIFDGRKYAINGIIKEEYIYKLICENVFERDIKMVWHDIQYKATEIQFILNVLINFELIFRLNNDTIFIPMLCDENEPESIDSFLSGKTVHLRYVYNYLPENVLQRLMVRHGFELKTNMVWRTGVVFKRKRCGWTAVVRIMDNNLDVYTKSDMQETHPVYSYLDMIRESIYRINEEFRLSAEEFIAYSKNDIEELFSYKTLLGSKETGITKVYSSKLQCAVPVDEILGIIINTKEKFIEDVIEQMFYVLAEMSTRCALLEKRSEIELTSDFQAVLSPLINSKFNLQIAREYTMGRALKNMGETDLYIFRNNNSIKEDIFILESKYIKNFVTQYQQLLGYLNPNFHAGITLSINKDKSWEEAFDFIYNRLDFLRTNRSEFSPISIQRRTDGNGTKYIKTYHEVPETGMTMPIYHLVLQLSDDNRKKIAAISRHVDL